MFKKILNFFISIKDFILRTRDKDEEIPNIRAPTIIIIITFIFLLISILWLEIWLPSVDRESARWALSTQTQATAAILGLLITAVAFRWRIVSTREERLRSNIFSYLTTIGTSKSETIPHSSLVIELAYEKYLNWINTEKEKKHKMDKSAFTHLGRLWAIKELAFVHSSGGAKELRRFLRYGQTKQLSKINKTSKESALKTWEAYHKDAAQFMLDMYGTLVYISIILFDLEKEAGKDDKVNQIKAGTFDIMTSVASQILSDGSKLLAEEIKRVRLTSGTFYFIGGVLILATVIGLLALTGISNDNSLLNANPNSIKWVIGIPVVLSVYGVFLCFDFIRRIWS